MKHLFNPSSIEENQGNRKLLRSEEKNINSRSYPESLKGNPQERQLPLRLKIQISEAKITAILLKAFALHMPIILMKQSTGCVIIVVVEEVPLAKRQRVLL